MKVVLSPNPYRDKGGPKAAQAADRILRENQVDTAMCLPFPLEKGQPHGASQASHLLRNAG